MGLVNPRSNSIRIGLVVAGLLLVMFNPMLWGMDLGVLNVVVLGAGIVLLLVGIFVKEFGRRE